jgi:NAD(P)H-hydrate epimerase
VTDIGIPKVLYRKNEKDDEVVTSQDVYACLPARSFSSHKGTYGRVLLIGGARGFSGAVCMAGMAAVRSGCGLVSALVPDEIADVVSAASPEMMVTPCSSSEAGSFCAKNLALFDPFLDVCDAVMIGPGMTPSEDTRKIVDYVIHKVEKPVLLDADALNVFADDVASFLSCSARLVLTPHPGEMGRLLGMPTAQVQEDRRAAVTRAARESGAVVVLKGAGTLVASDAFGVSLNLTGNPGMARGGSGDVLAGLLAGLLAQGIEPYHAACCAVYLHGLAGDYAAMQETVMTMTPTDLIACLSRAVRACVKC